VVSGVWSGQGLKRKRSRLPKFQDEPERNWKGEKALQNDFCSPESLLASFFSTPEQEKSLLLLVGSSGAGKTTWCRSLVETAQARGLHVGGLLSLAVFQEGIKTAIDLLDIQSGERRRLAERRLPQESTETRENGKYATGDWLLDPQVLTWGESILAQTGPLDLLIFDEAGPLEFERGQGLISGLKRLDARRDRLAVVTVRPGLYAQAARRWPWAQRVDLEACEAEA